MSSGSKSRPPWQSVGSGAKDVKALNARPAWQSVGAGRSASSRSTSPVKPRDSTKRGSQSPTRLPADYNRSHTLHAYASDTVSSSTGTTNNSVLTGSSAQSLDEAPAAAARKEQPGSAGRERSTVAPKTPVQRTPAPRKPAARTTAPRTPAPRTPGPRSPQPTKPNVKATSHSSDSNRTPKRRGTSRQAPRQSSVRPKDKDGWEADSEDSFTVVGVEPKPCIWSGDHDSHEVRNGHCLQPLATPHKCMHIILHHAPCRGLLMHAARAHHFTFPVLTSAAVVLCLAYALPGPACLPTCTPLATSKQIPLPPASHSLLLHHLPCLPEHFVRLNCGRSHRPCPLPLARIPDRMLPVDTCPLWYSFLPHVAALWCSSELVTPRMHVATLVAKLAHAGAQPPRLP